MEIQVVHGAFLYEKNTFSFSLQKEHIILLHINVQYIIKISGPVHVHPG